MNASAERLPAGALAPFASADKTSGNEGALFVERRTCRRHESRARQERENDVGLVGEEVARKRGSGGPAAEAASAWRDLYDRTCSKLAE
jgi:hypothetical protein